MLNLRVPVPSLKPHQERPSNSKSPRETRRVLEALPPMKLLPGHKYLGEYLDDQCEAGFARGAEEVTRGLEQKGNRKQPQ